MTSEGYTEDNNPQTSQNENYFLQIYIYFFNSYQNICEILKYKYIFQCEKVIASEANYACPHHLQIVALLELLKVAQTNENRRVTGLGCREYDQVESSALLVLRPLELQYGA